MKLENNIRGYENIGVVDKTYDSDEEVSEKKNQHHWKIFFRQVLICSIIWTLYFTYGLQIGAPTVIVAQLKRDTNSTLNIDNELTSWIISIIVFGAAPWIIILPILYDLIGRKVTIIFISAMGFIGALVIYLSHTILQILIGEFIFGIVLGSHMTYSPLIINEYASPEYRGLFLTIKSASAFWGMWVANTVGTFWHWKNIYYVHFICNIYTLTIFIWPESIYWLAKKERYEECKKSHRWIRGTSRSAEKELVHIINYYKLDQQKESVCKWYDINKLFISSFNKIKSKSFYKPLILIILAGLQYSLTGKLVVSIYAIQILKKITNNEADAYRAMLILDGVTVFATYCGCILSRYCKRRTLLFSTSSLTIIVLYTIALYLCLVQASVISENNYLSILFLSVFSITVCSGPMILLSTIYSELVPVRYQLPSMIIYGTTVNCVWMVMFKTAPSLFRLFTVSGTFLFFAITSSILTLFLYLYLPETKDKTLREIEEYFTGTAGLNKNEMRLMKQDAT